MIFTVWTEEVSIEDSQAKDVLLQVPDKELHAGVPVRVAAGHHRRLLLLRPHAGFAIHVQVTCSISDLNYTYKIR